MQEDRVSCGIWNQLLLRAAAFAALVRSVSFIVKSLDFESMSQVCFSISKVRIVSRIHTFILSFFSSQKKSVSKKSKPVIASIINRLQYSSTPMQWYMYVSFAKERKEREKAPPWRQMERKV
jgi:positive regulator of sigma E activity